MASVENGNIEKKYRQTLLYDFYGELLTSHQKKIYEEFVLNDLTLSEIAEEEGISRQGVHDLVKRCDKILEGYEGKLRLMERFLREKKRMEEIHALTYSTDGHDAVMERIRELSKEMIEEL